MLGDNSLLVSCISARLPSRHTDIFFWTMFSKMFIQQTALEDRDGVSLQGRGKICLMSRIFKKCLPLGKRTGRFASICLYSLGFPKFRFLMVTCAAFISALPCHTCNLATRATEVNVKLMLPAVL